jgi:hypothetical protein
VQFDALSLAVFPLHQPTPAPCQVCLKVGSFLIPPRLEAAVA